MNWIRKFLWWLIDRLPHSTVQVQVSLNESLGYVNTGCRSLGFSRPTFWLSFREPAADDPAPAVNLANHRRACLPFVFWKVKPGKRVRMRKDDPFVKDYAQQARRLGI